MQLPASVRQLLWEYDTADGAPSGRWERVAMERVMERGTLDDMRWLLSTFGRDRLREFLEERGRRVLPPRELRFWSRVCRVHEPRADRWVEEARERERVWRG